jgi:hypothetical protein
MPRRARGEGEDYQAMKDGHTLSGPERRKYVVKLQRNLGRDSGPTEVSTTRGNLAMPSESTRGLVHCAHCGSEFVRLTRVHKFCRPQCSRDAQASHWNSGHNPELPSSTRGAVAELRACVDLMARGFHVYRAMSPSCPADLVVWGANGRALRVEVKTASRHPVTGVLSLPGAPHNQFDVICYVTRDEVIYIPPVEEW